MTSRIRSFSVLVAFLLAIGLTSCSGGDEPVSQESPTSEPVPTVAAVAKPAATSTSVPATSTPRPTSTVAPSATPTAVPTLAPTATAVPQPTATVVPTPAPTPTAVPTVEPTSTPIPTETPTVGPPTPVPTATPIGYSSFSGSGTVETDSFISPPRLPWLIEWEATGTGANSIKVTLMDPDGRTDINVVVDDSGTGQIGGANLVQGNAGTFYLLVEGPDAGWDIWIYQDSR